MSFTSKGTLEILVAGWQNTMFVIDLTKGEVTKRVGLCPDSSGFASLTSHDVALDSSQPTTTTPS